MVGWAFSFAVTRLYADARKTAANRVRVVVIQETQLNRLGTEPKIRNGDWSKVAAVLIGASTYFYSG